MEIRAPPGKLDAMMRKLGAYLDLLRVFLTPTAAADSFAGQALAASLWLSGRRLEPATTAAVASTSILLYWLGMVANDIFDREKDRATAPHRPLPAGRVSLPEAAAIAFLLGAGALALGFWLGVGSIVASMVAVILAYDAGGKRLPVAGNVLMGLCRGGNLLLGAAAVVTPAAAVHEPIVLLAAAILTAYIAGVTAVSELEEAPFRRGRLIARATPCLLIAAALAAWPLFAPGRESLPLAIANGALAPVGGPGGPRRAAACFVHGALGAIFCIDAGIYLSLERADGESWGTVLTLYALFALFALWKRRWVRARAPDGTTE
jgi:4-hydroxybenzoate polyprenyltransferase